MSPKRVAPLEWELRKRYVDERWTLQRLAAYYKTSTKIVKRWLGERGIEMFDYSAPENSVQRKVDHYEELPYRTTLGGKVLTRTVAILECGHKCPVIRRPVPNEYSYDSVRTCKVCTDKGQQDGC